MKRLGLFALAAVVAGLLVLGCAKKAPLERTTAPTPAEKVVKAPETTEATGGEEAMLADKAPADAKAVPNPVKADTASLDEAKKLYADKCATCHGDNGDGKGPLGVGLTPPPADFTNKETLADDTDGTLFWVLTNGGGAMPNFKALSEKERWELVNFIRTFSK